MSEMDEMDDVVKEFLVESYENLDQLDRDLVALESDPSNADTLASIFRTIHTIKGTCGFLGFTKLESISHVGENLLGRLRDGQFILNEEITTALLSMVDAIREVLGNLEQTSKEGDGDYSALVAKLTALNESGETKPAAEAAPTAAPPAPATEPSAPTQDAPQPPATAEPKSAEAPAPEATTPAPAPAQTQTEPPPPPPAPPQEEATPSVPQPEKAAVETDVPLGEMLVETGKVKPEDVAQAVQKQAEGGTVVESSARRYPSLQPGRYAMIVVRDSGTGMDAATQSRIFDPFFTTKETDRGTGLGLATVYGIIRQSGGAILVSSTPGHGTTFQICLPEISETAAETPQETPATGSHHGTETILVVEDEEPVRKLICEYLDLNGYNVLSAGDPLDAVPLAQRHNGPLHLLITDMVMPKLRGSELAGQLQQVRKDLKVLYTSGYSNLQILPQATIRPDTNFLQKPYSLETLGKRVREILDEKT